MKLTRTIYFSALALFALSQGVQTAYAGDDLVFVAVDPPCRIVNTRNTGTANIPADGSTDFLAYGIAGTLDSQGGDAGGCPNPRPDSRPVAISVNITAVGNKATGNGNLVAYAAGGTRPDSSLVNYKVGTNIANSTIVALCQGTCASDFTVWSNGSAVPAIVDLQGFLYPKTLQNVITVSKENGDFTSPIDAINSIPTIGLDAPSASNPYLIKLGPGVYDLVNGVVQMQSFVSIIGDGVDSTTIRSVQGGGILRAIDVIDAEAAHMTIIGDGQGTFITEILGALVQSTNGESTNLHLHDLKIIAREGANRTRALRIGDPTNANNGDTSPLIERVDAVAEDAASGTESGIYINFCGDTRIVRVNAFGALNGIRVDNEDCTNPILWSQFDGGTDDVYADSATFTLGHSHLVNGTYTKFNLLGTVTCVAVTDPSGNRNSDCTAPSP